MNIYCASSLTILGAVYNKRNNESIQENKEVREYGLKQKIWLDLESERSAKLNAFTLKDSLINGSKKDVLPNLIFYPKLDSSQLIAHKSINFHELLDRTKTWDKKEPILPKHELSMVDDLTDNEIALRQINCAHILKRNLVQNLERRLSCDGQGKEVDFEFKYYEDKNYWLRLNFIMRINMFIFPFLYLIQSGFLKLILLIIGLVEKRIAFVVGEKVFDKLNIVV